MELIYGTGNPAKIKFMRRALCGLPCEIIGLTEAAQKMKIALPEIEENGKNPLENARIKALAYFKLFGRPVFSCDSGLYLWNYETGEMLPEKLQPGIHVRGESKKRLTDEELLGKYIEMVKKHGTILARYKNGICLIVDEKHVYEGMEEELWGEPFLLTDTPHRKIIAGFPLDSISVQLTSGKYYYDLETDAQDDIAAKKGFKKFFENCLET